MAWNKPNHRGGSGFLPGPNFGRQIAKPLAAPRAADEAGETPTIYGHFPRWEFASHISHHINWRGSVKSRVVLLCVPLTVVYF
jgi:hypothetical protein